MLMFVLLPLAAGLVRSTVDAADQSVEVQQDGAVRSEALMQGAWWQTWLAGEPLPDSWATLPESTHLVGIPWEGRRVSQAAGGAKKTPLARQDLTIEFNCHDSAPATVPAGWRGGDRSARMAMNSHYDVRDGVNPERHTLPSDGPIQPKLGHLETDQVHVLYRNRFKEFYVATLRCDNLDFKIMQSLYQDQDERAQQLAAAHAALTAAGYDEAAMTLAVERVNEGRAATPEEQAATLVQEGVLKAAEDYTAVAQLYNALRAESLPHSRFVLGQGTATNVLLPGIEKSTGLGTYRFTWREDSPGVLALEFEQVCESADGTKTDVNCAAGKRGVLLLKGETTKPPLLPSAVSFEDDSMEHYFRTTRSVMYLAK